MTIARADWPLLLTLVEQAMDHAPEERPAWLAGLALDAPLKEALRELLDQRRALETGDFLAELPALTGAASKTEPSGRLQPGTPVGPWRLLREVGEGGMCSVWLAERADDQLTRQVALKLPHAGPGQDLLARRLLRERNILASLEHRNIARLYDVGLTDAGTPYLVMEYVPGDTLLAHADAKHLTIAQRLVLFQQVLRAVQYAHGKLVLHRDIKPSNILVNEAGDVKLLDFGIAKPLAAEGATHDDTEFTRATGRPMTLSYASPEQLRGQPLGTASDVYSLGVVLYELLCGQRPHEAAGTSAARLEDAVLNLEPKPPSRQDTPADRARNRGLSTAALRKLLAGDLDAIVLKALAKAPEQRYGSAEALEADIGCWLAGRAVSARVPSGWYYLTKFVQRNRWAVGLGTAAVTMLMVISGVALVQGHLANQQAARAAAVRDFLVAMFDETDLDKSPSRELTAKALLNNGRQRAARTLAQAPDLMAELLQYIGKAQGNISDGVGADQTFSLAVDTYRQSKNRRGELLALLDQADNALALGRHDDAQGLLAQARALSPDGADPTVEGPLSRMQGGVALFKGDYRQAKDSFERYLRLTQDRRGDATSDWTARRVSALQDLATATSYLGDLPAALALIDQATDALVGQPDLVAAKMDLFNYRQDIEFRWGHYGRILRLSPKEIQECDRSLSPESPICMKLKGRLQLAQLRLGMFAEAQSWNGALASMLNPSSPRDQVKAATALARALAYGGRTNQLPEAIERLKRIAEAGDGDALDAPYRLEVLEALADVHVLSGHPAEALRWVALADAIPSGDAGILPLTNRYTRVPEGAALAVLGQAAKALVVMDHFCSAPQRSGGMARVKDHYLSLNCVAPLVGTGQADAAIALLQKVLPVLRENLGPDAPTVRRAQHWLDSLRSGQGLPPSTTTAEVFFR